MRTLGKSGSIVLMGSMGGIVGAGITVAYSTSKGAVTLMAKALADVLGPAASVSTPSLPAPSIPPFYGGVANLFSLMEQLGAHPGTP
ncbi:SDR family NAD(P)-dependent oxidoreductase [Streptomyces griseoloalbus]|uniref:SDR family NAD(P)-dependent oxidoreductase n=1 Tax=Streptomyces griseoloalbus TaxID=67303 RepID=A0ABV3E748_9ACTN